MRIHHFSQGTNVKPLNCIRYYRLVLVMSFGARVAGAVLISLMTTLTQNNRQRSLCMILHAGLTSEDLEKIQIRLFKTTFSHLLISRDELSHSIVPDCDFIKPVHLNYKTTRLFMQIFQINGTFLIKGIINYN